MKKILALTILVIFVMSFGFSLETMASENSNSQSQCCGKIINIPIIVVEDFPI